MSFPTVFDALFRLWFLASASAITLFAGWSAAHYGLAWQTATACAGSAGLWTSSLWRGSMRTVGAHCAVIALILAGGFAVGSQNILNMNTWMDNSTQYIETALFPVEYFDGNEGRVAVTESQRKTLQKRLTGLNLAGNVLEKPMLVSFHDGLAVVQGKKVHYVSGKPVRLASLSLLPDGTFFYYTASNRSTFTRAQLVDGELEKIWTRKTPGLALHHWGDSFNGLTYQPGKDFVQLPNNKSQQIGHDYAACATDNSSDDIVRIFDTETGEIVRSINLMDMLAASDAEDMKKAIYDCADPLHLNDIQIVRTQEHADYFPDGKIGDILVSMRKVNSLMLLDRDTGEIKWSVTNLTKRQHSPRITDRGTLIVFDNFGSDRDNGRSQVTEIDIAKRVVVGSWDATGDDTFESYRGGKLIPLNNEDTLVLSQEGYKGEASVFMLHCLTGSITSDCEKKPVFDGTAPYFAYDNAVVLP